MGRKRNPKNINKYSKTYRNVKKIIDKNEENYTFTIEVEDQDKFKEGDMFGVYDKKKEYAFGFNLPIFHTFIIDKGELKSIKNYGPEDSVEFSGDQALIMGNIHEKIKPSEV